MQRGFAVAVPRPDILGEDLWFTREDCAPRLYLAQSKSMWKPDHEGKYVTNIAARWFMRALHQANFIFVFGPLDEGDERFGFVPASVLRGQRFLVSKKDSRQAVNLYLKPPKGADSRYILHNGAKMGERFVADVTECFQSHWEEVLTKCLSQSDANTCQLLTSKMNGPFKGKRGKEYSLLSRCDHCETAFISEYPLPVSKT